MPFGKPKSKRYLNKNGLAYRSDSKAQRKQQNLDDSARRENFREYLDNLFAKTEGWSKLINESLPTYSKLDTDIVKVLTFRKDNTWSLKLNGNDIPKDSPLLSSLSLPSGSVLTELFFTKIISTIESLKYCKAITGFQTLDVSNDKNLTKLGPDELRHASCLKFFTPARESLSQRCSTCTGYRRNTLAPRLRRALSSTTTASSNVNYRHMSHETLSAHTNNLQKELKVKKTENARLREKVDKLMQHSVLLDKSNDSNAPNEHVRDIVVNALNSKTPDLDSDLKRLLWEQQARQAAAKGKKGMRWHPMIIRWALTLKSISSSSYSYLKESGFLSLPSESTLNSYTTYKKISYGVDLEGIDEFSEKIGDCRDICLMFDEIKIKDQLVYEKGTGRMIGYVELGDINQALASLGTEAKQSTASHVLCFMARALKSRTCIPVAHYATNAMTADQVYHMFWEVVAALELSNIHVRSCVSDGASINRRFINLHHADYADTITYRAKNLYSSTPRNIYFVSDVPHLIKTTCNCFENSHANLNTRNLMLHGKPILWSHVTRLFEEKIAHTSFEKLHKLTSDHVKKSSYGRMRVSLAAQVLSQSVANALRIKGDPMLASTIEFVEKVNRAFDMLNVRYKAEGRRTRNPDKDPYTSIDDDRLRWLQDEFVGWLDEWREEIESVPNIEKDDANRAQLSAATITGWKITCSSFISLCKELLLEGYEYVLSEKLLCQDNVENHFGHQRQAGGANRAPTASEYLRNEKTFSVIREVQLPTMKGNCRGGVARRKLQIDNTPLSKKSKPHN